MVAHLDSAFSFFGTLRDVWTDYRCLGRTDQYQSLASRVESEYAHELNQAEIKQLTLVRVESPCIVCSPDKSAESADELRTSWHWIDPQEDCIYNLSDDGVHIIVPPHHDLWLEHQQNAPRLLHPLREDGAVETWVCRHEQRMMCGGVLSWQDSRNFVHLSAKSVSDSGSGLPIGTDIRMAACIKGVFSNPCFHLLEVDSVGLRLVREKEHFTGYISSGEQEWLRCGWVDLYTTKVIQVGIHALASWTEPSSTRFEYVKLWQS